MNYCSLRLTGGTTAFLIATILIFIIPEQVLAKKTYLRIGNTVDMPSVGIKMKMPKDAEAKPLGSISVQTLTQRRGNETRKLDTYFPEDLWLRDQLLGRWGNPQVMVSVYSMSLPPPSGVPTVYQQAGKSFVTKEAYDQWKETQDGKWNKEMVPDWIGYVTGQKIQGEPESMKKGGPPKAETNFYEIKDQQGLCYVYIITPARSPDKPVAIQFLLANDPDLDKDKSKKAIEQCLASMTFNAPVENVDKGKKISISGKPASDKKEWSPEYIASRERVINNIKNLKDWWYLETDNFIMVSDIKNKKTVRELYSGLEQAREVFSKVFPIREPLNAVSVAKSFETRDGYVAYIGKEYEWTAGLWMSDKKELVVSPMDWGSVKDRRKMIVDVIQHEGFHQYIYFATGEQQTAVWFNEGNATFFEGITFKGKKAYIEETRRLEEMTKLAAAADIQRLINMDYNQFVGGSRSNNYTLVYGLMFFLHKGAPVIKKKNNYSEIPTRYYEALLKTKNPGKANEIAWEGVDMNEFTREFREFWGDKTMVKKALRYDIIKAKELEFAKK